jgi:hypothetical protein
MSSDRLADGAPRYPRGADIELAHADEGSTIRGRVVSAESTDTPFGRVESAGFGLTLISHLAGRPTVMLRLAQAASFEVKADDDRIVTVPAGRIHLSGPTRVFRDDFHAMTPWLQGLLTHLDADMPTPFPFDEAHHCWLRRGDVVELRGWFESADRSRAEGPYRSRAPKRGVVRVDVIER